MSRAPESDSCLPEGLPRPAASPDGLDASFWDAAREHRLVIQRCNRCATFQHGPEWICHACQSSDLGWHQVSGRGNIYSWQRAWRAAHPALTDSIPYLLVMVELADAGNARLIGNLLGDPRQDVVIDAPVEAVFEDHDGYTLIQWRRV